MNLNTLHSIKKFGQCQKKLFCSWRIYGVGQMLTMQSNAKQWPMDWKSFATTKTFFV